jgi:hypothetical protein
MPIAATEATGELRLSGSYLLSTYPPAPRDTTLDQIFDFEDLPGVLALSGTGDWLSRRWSTAATGTLLLSGTGLRVVGVHASIATGTLTLSGLLSAFTTQSAGIGETAGSNWLRWSKIGQLNFTIDRSNEAGQMPLPFRGALYAIMRRGASVIVYGKNGVALLSHGGVAFGYTVLLHVGLKSKQAVVDTGDAHYFIDSKARLWKLTDGPPQLLDYREWLGGLGSPVMTFHPERRLLYMCDGTLGYVFNPDTNSLGKGPATVTGVGLQSGTLYVTASGAMTIPNFEITTDITDFGTRKAKSIQSLEVGLDSGLTIQAAIDYRHNKQAAFLTTNWYTVDSRGQVFIACLGYEFRFKLKATAAGVFHVDSLRVNGVIHAH